MEALCDELVEFGTFHLYRPYNDMRFAKGRPPYKTHQGAFTRGPEGGGHYVQISADGLMAAAGYYVMAKDQLDRFRNAVDDPAARCRGRRPGRWAGRLRLRDRRPRDAEDGAPRLPQGPSPRRVAPPQGADGVEVVAGRPVDVWSRGDTAGCGACSPTSPRCAAWLDRQRGTSQLPLRPTAPLRTGAAAGLGYHAGHESLRLLAAVAAAVAVAAAAALVFARRPVKPPEASGPGCPSSRLPTRR